MLKAKLSKYLYNQLGLGEQFFPNDRCNKLAIFLTTDVVSSELINDNLLFRARSSTVLQKLPTCIAWFHSAKRYWKPTKIFIGLKMLSCCWDEMI